MPPDERDHIERMDELCGFLEQSNISAKNIARSKILTQHASSEVSHLAALVLDIARVKPHKRRRWKFLAHNHFDLFVRLKKFWGDAAFDELPDLSDFPDLDGLDLPFSLEGVATEVVERDPDG